MFKTNKNTNPNPQVIMRNAKDMLKDIRDKGLIPAFTIEDYFSDNDDCAEAEYYIEASEDGSQMIYGTLCNVGLLEHGRLEFNSTLPDDENLQALVEFAVENQ